MTPKDIPKWSISKTLLFDSVMVHFYKDSCAHQEVQVACILVLWDCGVWSLESINFSRYVHFWQRNKKSGTSKVPF